MEEIVRITIGFANEKSIPPSIRHILMHNNKRMERMMMEYGIY